MAGKRFTQGLFTPRNPHKYVGDPTKIRYMSSYELETHKFFDGNEHVLRWSSEEIAIPYIKPTDNRVHKYYPDYWVEYVNKDGEVVQEIIEVKPASQTRAPRANSKHKLYEQLTLAVNIAKWQAAQAFCNAKGIKFRIITEKSIFK
jgi:TnsA endonuclease N terminal